MHLIVVETSALVSVILLEPGADILGPKILSGDAIMAAPSYLEAYMVLKKHLGEGTGDLLSRHLRELGITIVPFMGEYLGEAMRAFDRFGKGRHPAALNFGDCIAYATAQATGRGLLFVGDDFSKTDVRVA